MTYSTLSSSGQNTLWLVFALQGIAAVVYGVAGFRLPAGKRDHFSTPALALLIVVEPRGVLHCLDLLDAKDFSCMQSLPLRL